MFTSVQAEVSGKAVEGSTRETLRQSELRYQGELAIQAAQGITIDVPEVNAQSVRQVIDAMAEANPDLAWLQAMEARGDINWRQVEAIHDSWSYSQSPRAGRRARGQHRLGRLGGSRCRWPDQQCHGCRDGECRCRSIGRYRRGQPDQPAW